MDRPRNSLVRHAKAEERPGPHTVTAWQSDGVLLERYSFAPQLTVSLAPHFHEQYQFGLSLTDAGEYHYRGAYHPVPVGSLSVIQPGEIHGVSGLGVRPAPSVFLSFYVPVDLVQRVWGEAQGRPVVTPLFVPQPIITDLPLEREFRKLHGVLTDPARLPLEREAALSAAVFSLFHGYSEQPRRHKKTSLNESAVRRAREFLDAHYAEPVSYEVLARKSGLSAFHLSRSFRSIVGVPPHQYQLQRRIDRAKLLLLTEMPVPEIAVAAGFAQQSHFGQQFRRFVGVSPGQYGRWGIKGRLGSRNLIDRIARPAHP